MVILHIASITDNACSGVSVVVPKHVTSQSHFADVALLNIKNSETYGQKVPHLFFYDRDFSLEKLTPPFNAPDLVVFHETYVPEYLKIYKILKKHDVPYLIIPHGELSEKAQKKKWIKKSIANFLLFNRFIKGAIALQCLSKIESDSTHFKAHKFVGTNGIDVTARSKHIFHDSALVFTYIGRLDIYHKGLDLLIKGVSSCADFLRNNKCQFHIYGPDYHGRFRQVNKLISKHNLSDIVFLNHEVTGEEKCRVLDSSDAFIQTSRFEGMPLGVLEAMSLGIPCFVTNGTNLGELIGTNKAGWNVETSDDAIANGLTNAVASRKMFEKYGDNALQIVRDTFDWNKVSERTVQQYKKMLFKL